MDFTRTGLLLCTEKHKCMETPFLSETVFEPGGKLFDPSIKPLFQEAEGVISRAMPGKDV